MDSEIYYTENDAKSVVLSCCDIQPDEMRTWYMQTLEYAVLHHTIDYLGDYPYYYQVDIQSVLSPFIINHLNCKGTNLVITRKKLVDGHSDALDSNMCYEYYSHELIKSIKYPEPEEESEETPSEIPDEEESTNMTYLDTVIYQWLTNQTLEIDRKEIIPYMLRVDNYTYRMMPLIMYVIMKYYDSYFKKTEL